MNFDWKALGKTISDLIVATGKQAGVEASADFKKYAKLVGKWASDAVAAKDIEMLKTCEGIVKLIGAKQGLSIQKKGLAVAVQVVTIVIEAFFAAMGVQ